MLPCSPSRTSLLAIRATIATVGTVRGVQEARAQAEHVKAQAGLAEAFQRTIDPLDITGTLAAQIRDALGSARPEVPVQLAGDTAHHSGGDQTLTIRMSQLTFLEYRPWHSKDPTRYALALTAIATLDNPDRPAPIHHDYYSYRTEYLPFAAWAEQDAALFRAELQQAYRQLADDIVDELFRIYRDDQSPGLARTAFARGYFIHPLSVDPQSLRYDLRLYDAQGNELARSDALGETHYQVPGPLQPCTLYRWTVRSRFTLEGRDRVTDWSGCYNGFEPWNVNYPFPRLFGDRDSPTLMPDRKLFFFRFRTPETHGGRCA